MLLIPINCLLMSKMVSGKEDYVFSSIIPNRKAKGLSTYIAYIDFEKAFDRIDRKLLITNSINRDLW